MNDTESAKSSDRTESLVEVITTDPEFRCPGCGFDPGQLQPSSAAAAARSFGRRWRELFDSSSDAVEDRSAALTQPDDAGWSPLDRARRVALVLDAEAGALNVVWLRDRPVLVSPTVNTDGPVGPDVDDVLSSLATAGEFLARRIDDYGVDGWDRVGIREGREVSALHLIREAIHEGVHHLRHAADDLEPLGVHDLERDGD